MRHRRWAPWALLLLLPLAGCAKPVDAGPAPDAAKVAAIRKTLKAKASEDEKSSSESAAAAQSDGWATLKATVKLVGSAPPRKALGGITAECAAHQEKLVDESIVAGPGGELQAVALYLTRKAPAIHEQYHESATAKVVLDNKDCRFEPHVLAIRTTQTLVVKNSDSFGHNTKLEARRGTPVSPLLGGHTAQELKLTAQEQAPIQFGCNIHPWMGGWMLVRDDPYAAVSNAQGEITLAQLPTGVELEFQLWHEKPQGLKGAQIDGVKIDGKGRFKLKLENGKDLNLDIQVPIEALK